MNRFSDVPSSSSSRSSSGRRWPQTATAMVEGKRHDISNLCLFATANAPFALAGDNVNTSRTTQSHLQIPQPQPQPHRVRPRKSVRSLYPATHTLPDIPIAALIFNKIDATHPPKPSSHHPVVDPVADEDDDDVHLGLDHTNSNHSNDSNRNNNTDNEQFDRPLIEISPGCRVELRGSDETWRALQRGFSRQLQCPCCDEHLFVIRDAAMVLCPECRMIVPIRDTGKGMGLGVRVNATSDESIAKQHQHQQQVARTKSGTYTIKDPPKRHDSLKDSNHSIQKQRTPTTMMLGGAGAGGGPGPHKAVVSRERSESPRVLTRPNF